MHYRPEIDGLRALAIIPVVLFHAGFDFFSGGYVGVDIFFVISGYLITYLIISELKNNTFKLASFYERRVRRIFPALFFVVISCMALSWAFMLPNGMAEFSKSIISVVFFVSNLYFWDTSGYFATESTLIPLLHTWSLAVEEQFYIIFPILFLFLHRLRAQWKIFLIGLFALLSLAFSQYSATHFPETAYYLLHARMWELFLGVLAAIYLTQYEKEISFTLKNYLSILGLMLVILPLVYFDEQTIFPGFYALIPTLGTLMIILFASTSGFVGKLLSNRYMVGIGLISYSTYLWHQPIFVYSRIILTNQWRGKTIDNFSFTEVILISILPFIIGFISWKYIESPFRVKKGNLNYISNKVLIGLFGIGVMLIASFGLGGVLTEGYMNRVSDEVKIIQNYEKDINPRRAECHSSRTKYLEPSDACIIGDSNNVIGALLGDSHADALVVELDKLLKHKKVGIMQYTYGGCPPMHNIYRTNKSGDKCQTYFTEVYKILKNSNNLKNIIFHARWSRYWPGLKWVMGSDTIEYGGYQILGFYNETGTRKKKYKEEIVAEKLSAGYQSIVNTQLKNKKRVILVYPVPFAVWQPPTYYAKMKFMWGDLTPDLETNYENFIERNKKTYSAFSHIINSQDLIRVYPENIFCNRLSENKCSITSNDILFYKDWTHLSNAGAKLLSTEIVKSLQVSQ